MTIDWRSLRTIYLLLPILLMTQSLSVSARQNVHPKSRYCNYDSGFLECDFKGIEQEVHLDKLQDNDVKKVSLHDAKELTVSGTPCINLQLSSIPKVSFIQAHRCHNVENLSLKVIDSKLNIVPKYFANLEMEHSYVDWIVSDKKFQSLSIINSRVGTINLTEPIDNGVIVRIENSKIDNLDLLKIKNDAQFLMINTTIRNLKENSLQLTDASANIWMSSVQMADANSINLGLMSTLSLSDVTGKLLLSGPQENYNQDEARAPGVPPPANVRRPSRSTISHWAWIIPTMIAMLEAMIIMVNCTNWFPGLKSTPKRKVDEEVMNNSKPGPGTSGSSAYYTQDGQSSVFYSSEGDANTLNKRNTGKNS